MPQIDYKKHVLSICDISPTRFGSFEEFIIALTKRLNENNLEHMVVFREKPIKSIEDSLLSLGAKIEIIKPSKNNICNFLKFYKLIRKNRSDIVHFHFYPVYTIINYLKFILNIKIVYTDHMGIRVAKTHFKKTIRRIYYLTNSKIFGCGVDKIVCVSHFVKQKYSKEYGINSNKLCVIYNGINTDRFQKKCEIEKIKEKYNIKNEYVVTCVGLRKDKGAHCLIKVTPSIIEKESNVKFFLVGDGEYRNCLEEYISKLDMEKYFTFVGITDSIEEIYTISSCVVIPTLVEEAFCFVAVEAMSTETPVIAYDSGAIKEILYNKENAICRSSKMLSDNIVKCLRSNDLFIKNAREHVIKNYSLDNNTCKHIELYKQLLK